MKIGMIFPGQGSQFIGMAKEFYDVERIVQEYFEEASNCLNQNFVKLCFASSDKDLQDTSNFQTSIFLVSVAVFSLLKEKYNIVPDIVAGHDVGEYAALFAAGGFNFPDGLYLLKKQSQFLDEITFGLNSGMLSVQNITEYDLRVIVDKYNMVQDFGGVQIAYYNSPLQFVVSGSINELEKVKSELDSYRVKSSFIKVSGAFNSILMHEAEKTFAMYLEKVDFHDLKIALVSGVDAKLISSSQEVKQALIKQISHPVLWWQAMQHFYECDVIIEIAPGSHLTNILRQEWKEKCVLSVNNQDDINQLLGMLGREIPEKIKAIVDKDEAL